jgi:hypothetical protein
LLHPRSRRLHHRGRSNDRPKGRLVACRLVADQPRRAIRLDPVCSVTKTAIAADPGGSPVPRRSELIAARVQPSPRRSRTRGLRSGPQSKFRVQEESTWKHGSRCAGPSYVPDGLDEFHRELQCCSSVSCFSRSVERATALRAAVGPQRGQMSEQRSLHDGGMRAQFRREGIAQASARSVRVPRRMAPGQEGLMAAAAQEDRTLGMPVRLLN